jgi:hypothetical protein
MFVNNDKSRVCFAHIDMQIQKMINEGRNIDFIKEELSNKITKFQSILSNISEDSPRYNFINTHNLVCQKRITDFNFFLQSKCFGYTTLKKTFKLIKFRDKLTSISGAY